MSDTAIRTELQMHKGSGTRLLTDAAYLSACLTKVPRDMQQASSRYGGAFEVGGTGYPHRMTDEKRAEIERQARCFLHPILRGSEADRAVAYILAWEEANPDAEAHARAEAWYRIELLAA